MLRVNIGDSSASPYIFLLTASERHRDRLHLNGGNYPLPFLSHNKQTKTNIVTQVTMLNFPFFFWCCGMSKGDCEAAYLAGLFDSRGTICFDALNRVRVVSLKLEIDSKEIVHLFFEKFGGIVRYKSTIFTMCYWFLDDSDKVLAALKILFPYLLVKKDQAELAVSYLQLLLNKKSGGVKEFKRVQSELVCSVV